MRKIRSFIFAISAALVLAASDLSQEQMKMLQDPGGWQYITVSDSDSGIQTKHTCFDGRPHPDECSGTLTLRSDKTFAKDIYIHHQGVQRTGTYELNGDQLAFFDEFGTEDGPYTVGIDTASKTMTLDMPQLHIGLQLQSAYKKELKKADEQ
jgi:cold shock CspA family protein